MDSAQPVAALPLQVKDAGPLPMSFPAILRNPGLSDRFAHLRIHQRERPAPAVAKQNRRDDNEGKRWVRRKENARFVGNVHIVPPSQKDFGVPMSNSRTTFPEPLPKFLSRNNPIPPAIPAAWEPTSANAGQFSMSLKGMRKELRRAGPRTELLVKEVEEEIVSWLTKGGVMLSPDSAVTLDFPGQPIGTSDAIKEVSRTPLQLVWSISDDAYTRYIVHCCARYHDVVSFSKDTSDQRLTYLLRPNVTRPTHPIHLDTPPITDFSELSANDFDTESDFVSDRDASDIDGPTPARTNNGLTAIVEVGSDASAPASPVMAIATVLPPASGLDITDDRWSVLGESDVEGDMSAPEGGDLVRRIASLALSDAADADVDVERTPQADARRRQGPDMLRSRLLERQRRSASSPSRSPARRPPVRPRHRVDLRLTRAQLMHKKSFYDFLFA